MKIPIPLSVYDGRVAEQPSTEVWVRGGDFPANVARKMFDEIQGKGFVLVAAIGSAAVNQAIKGLAIARQMWRDILVEQDLAAAPYFSTVIDEKGNDRTRIVLVVYPIEDTLVLSCLRRQATQ